MHTDAKIREFSLDPKKHSRYDIAQQIWALLEDTNGVDIVSAVC